MLAQAQFASRFLQVTVITRGGEKVAIPFNDGDRLFDLVEGTNAQELQGACGGNMACGGCHCIIDAKHFQKPEEDEADVLENSNGKTDTSRLACNLRLTPEFDGAEIKIGPQ